MTLLEQNKELYSLIHQEESSEKPDDFNLWMVDEDGFLWGLCAICLVFFSVFIWALTRFVL
ncbi:MAG TPA: hypothetical protein DCQ26_13815 [Marinilabiliales bacterium]|jgi:hypothetical protein|nr:MAG: hypothetical protein A2W95_05940 [Bacteroidetes bacterium GWA2_40_14]OFX56941.1 MAG: hypothetical protein A2W84_01240 [Bacteroidetes bacterium GWC2_40_13]OFX71652.1 MAG: hypothetical protein A2W96_09755 [Bacteroidetes bacterium GWD2_40_43]OFX90191.1 MAG: hypothetical protein A2W97_16940 [Bacteroidetes bacterium GWE2_40_63]OFY18663.1 MAG: hypothetical protein A2W88_05325 [Bacteroidetes bacterium GWF2_40_13]OFZ27654.1 MAG: hypothetical protein A2437_01660 [Bacteroidetes bacterium RIFOXYC